MANNLVKTSYSKDDVVILLKDIGGEIKEIDTADREKLIQQGVHYSEMLPVEHKPSDEYMQIYYKALHDMSDRVALNIAVLSERLISKHRGEFVIISLARAGIPVGILVKRYVKMVYGLDLPHYGISIIRGKGFDENALKYIHNKHGRAIGAEHFQFLDGWTGKGAITKQLNEAVENIKRKYTQFNYLSSDLAVLADPANICNICGTHEDYLVPNACLNGTVSGLISRTVLRDDLINVAAGDFHGAVYFEQLENVDKSIEFIDTITEHIKHIATNKSRAELNYAIEESKKIFGETGIDVVTRLANEYGINDINLIKPGVGETTRVLLRRMPWKVLVDTSHSNGEISEDIEHIIRLCNEKGVPIDEHKLGNYQVCGIIKNVSADA